MKNYNEYINGELDPHQVEAVEYGLRHNYFVNGDEMGIGKSLEALMISFITGLPTLIVCPASLKYNWEYEINKFSKTYKSVSVMDTGKEIYTFCPDMDDFVIINYEQLKHAKKLFQWAGIVIADEAHYLKEITAQRSLFFDKYLHETCAKKCMLLTGTPIENRVDEWYQLLVLCGFDIEGKSGPKVEELYPTKNKFCEMFAHKRLTKIMGRMTVKWEGLKNADALRKLRKGKYIRRLQEDVMALPETLDNPIVVSYKQHKNLLKAWDKHAKTKDQDITAKKRSADLKAPFTIRYVRDMLARGDGPIVVFTDHQSTAHTIANAFGGNVISGKVSKKRRNELVLSFEAGNIDVLVCTIKTAGVGLTLVAANQLVFNDLSWVPGQNKQARKRIHRRGQTRMCVYHYMIGSPQDKYIQDMLKRKEKVIKEAT